MDPISPSRSFVLPAIVWLCVSAQICLAQGTGAAHTQVQSHVPIQAQVVKLINLSCSASPNRVFSGGVVTIQAQGSSLQGLTLHYTFTTDAGQLSASGAVARLNTAGLAPRKVNVTCTATDSADRSASETVEITVMVPQQTEELHIPAADGKPKQVSPPVSPPVIVGPPAGTATEKPMKKEGETAAPSEPAKVKEPPPATVPPPPAPVPAKPDAEKPKPPIQGEAAQPTSAASPDVYKSSSEMEDWVSQLKQGKIEYKVPQKMLLLHAATVTVVIHGYHDVKGTVLEQPTGSASLKQSPRMKVELLAEDDPDNFTIALENGEMVKDVQSNGATTWIWKVTPNKSGTKQRIKILVSLMYPNADKSEIPLEDYHTTVEVDVASLWSTVVDDYQHDPMKFFSYMIPGGAGFTFIAGLVVWWWRRKHKDEKG